MTWSSASHAACSRSSVGRSVRRQRRALAAPSSSSGSSGLLVGYGWLAVSGVLWIVSGLSRTSVAYDAALQTLFLGFVISMIMAHAPIVIPALAGLPFPFTPAFWAPLAFLQVSILIRVAGGLAGNFELRRWGAMLNAVALGLFLLMVIGTVIRGQRTKYVARIT